MLIIVEDESETASELAEFLSNENFETRIFNDSRSFESSFCDLIENTEALIIDLRMPFKSGFDLIKTVREQSPKIPIIILTGHGTEKDMVRALDLGANSVLLKPVELNILMETLRMLITETGHINVENL
jgi:DNA-binding response OmpR family regulator